jgi:hypothetical protein
MYTMEKLDRGLVIDLQCPYNECKSPLTLNILKCVLDPDVFDKFDSLLLDVGLESMSDVFICVYMYRQNPTKFVCSRLYFRMKVSLNL